jgi:hypothetical protein
MKIAISLIKPIRIIFLKENFIYLKAIKSIGITIFIGLIEYKFINKIHKDFISEKGILLLG